MTLKLSFLFKFLFVLSLLIIMVMPVSITRANQWLPNDTNLQSNSAAVSPDRASYADDLLQFASAGHVLGFSSQQVYMAGMGHTLKVEFNGSRPVQPVATAGSTGQNGVASLGTVSYCNVWENIDINYNTAAGGIAESTYIIKPGANPAAINLAYNMPVEIEPGGSLRISFEKGCMTESAPIAWQDIDGQQVTVAVAFQKRGDSQVGFALGKYDSGYPVFIDPTYVWHTFYGGAGDDYPADIAVDSSGNIYLSASSAQTWNGPTAQAPLHAHSGASDITVLKLNSSGAYQWHTFYGGTGADYGNGIALDSSANIYVLGNSAATWNGPGSEAPKNAYGSGDSVNSVVLKLNSSGIYQWHSFYKGGQNDGSGPRGIAADSSANIYFGSNASATWNGPASETPKRAFSGSSSDIEVVKLDRDGVYKWHTFQPNGSAVDLALDSSANVYVASNGLSAWTGPAGEAPINAYTSGADMCVVKLDKDGTYKWHTFHGGTNDQSPYSIAVDSSANVYETAFTQGPSWNGTGGQAPLNPKPTGSHWTWTILKLNTAGAYQWHTFYGSTITSNDRPYGIAVDSSANVYVTGNLKGTFNGPAGQAPAHAYSGEYDIGILKLDSSGAYQWHTYYGSTAGYDYGQGIAVDSSNNVYVTGFSSATWNGDSSAAPLHAYVGSVDIAVLKLYDPPPPPPAPVAGPVETPGSNTGFASPQMPERFTSAPAQMTVKYLDVQPRQAQANQPITIYANIANSGDEAGKYTATLKINGEVEKTVSGTVGSKVARPLEFTISRSQPGTYTVDINGQKSSFVIVDDGGNKIAPSMNWAMIGFIACAIGVVIIVTLLILRRRSSYY